MASPHGNLGGAGGGPAVAAPDPWQEKAAYRLKLAAKSLETACAASRAAGSWCKGFQTPLRKTLGKLIKGWDKDGLPAAPSVRRQLIERGGQSNPSVKVPPPFQCPLRRAR